MAATKKFVALDSNFVLDLSGRDPSAIKLAEILQQKGFSLVVTPTVVQELASLAEDDRSDGHNEAILAFSQIRLLKITPVVLPPLQHGYAEQFSEYIRSEGILDPDERQDGEILAEASLVGATFLISSDAHLCRIDVNLLRVAYSDKGLDPVTVVNKKNMLQGLGIRSLT